MAKTAADIRKEAYTVLGMDLLPDHPVLYDIRLDSGRFATQDDLDQLETLVQTFIFRPQGLAHVYRLDFAVAENPKAKPLNVNALGLKLIEEAVEVALALGYGINTVQLACQAACAKEAFKMDTGYLGAPAEPQQISAIALREELADVIIVAETLAGFYPGESQHTFIEAKRRTNAKRLWRVNEFGALSNRGEKP